MLQPWIVDEEHYETAQRVKQTLQRYKELQDIIAILGLDELSEEDRLIDSPLTVQEYVELGMSGSTGEHSFADIITSIRYWVIHSITIPSLFIAGEKSDLVALVRTFGLNMPFWPLVVITWVVGDKVGSMEFCLVWSIGGEAIEAKMANGLTIAITELSYSIRDS
ncbi:hypothetical protein EZV62_014601 [Acer yangbiense]|uniref:H(+)-transporting two-sector ATPase n=1 Tax=Acer yangbiense TaxID=1000413 RepID=A0A5C7HT55_9ROSI|nr:hypothetical protein EZV62_014601 [Acer yangbiense]